MLLCLSILTDEETGSKTHVWAKPGFRIAAASPGSGGVRVIKWHAARAESAIKGPQSAPLLCQLPAVQTGLSALPQWAREHTPGWGRGGMKREREEMCVCMWAWEITHCPPKSCMPSRAKTTMKRKRRKSKLMIDFIELRREITRFLSEFQYLRGTATRNEQKQLWGMVEQHKKKWNKLSAKQIYTLLSKIRQIWIKWLLTNP